jgi:hypothetical protein
MVVRKLLSLHMHACPDVDHHTHDKRGLLDHPPEPGNFFELPAGGFVTSQLACNKGATKWRDLSKGRSDVRQGYGPCPGSKLHVGLFLSPTDTDT